VHDTVGFEIQGRPAVFVASSEFIDAAEAQAQTLGLPELRWVIVPHPIQDATDDEMRARADAALDPLLASLTQGDGGG
jgi:alkanesulfonate monooxygenase SsuD/methylene tetrahydromethanopterin reductase-like flavin-dependent oxidoreductase (luciferase family)